MRSSVLSVQTVLMTLNGAYPMVDAAHFGLGAAYVPEDCVAEHLASSALEPLLDDWSPRFLSYTLYYPSRHQNQPALRIVVDALRRNG